jgi:hypothetical protein
MVVELDAVVVFRVVNEVVNTAVIKATRFGATFFLR